MKIFWFNFKDIALTCIASVHLYCLMTVMRIIFLFDRDTGEKFRQWLINHILKLLEDAE